MQLSVEACCEAACIYQEEKNGDFCRASLMEGISVGPV